MTLQIPTPALDLGDDPRLGPIRNRSRILDDGCWLWLGTKHSNGYGVLRVPVYERTGRASWVVLAHRLACAISYGVELADVSSSTFALHWCDRRDCVNPDHLRFGTARQNTHDSIAAGTCHLAFIDGKCIRGHDATNPYITPDGRRNCRECRRLAARRAEARRTRSRANPRNPQPERDRSEGHKSATAPTSMRVVVSV